MSQEDCGGRRNLQVVHHPSGGQRPGCQFDSEKKYHTVGGDPEGKVMEIDGDVTSPSTVKETHHILTDRLMKRPTVE